MKEAAAPKQEYDRFPPYRQTPKAIVGVNSISCASSSGKSVLQIMGLPENQKGRFLWLKKTSLIFLWRNS